MRTTILAAALLCSLSFGARARTRDPATETYPDAQARIKKRLDEIWASAAARDFAKLESFHLYGPKFTSFKEGQPRGNAEANRAGEREIFSALVDPKVDMKDLAIAVYGDTAVATFNGDFSGKLGGKPTALKQAATLVFVNYKGDWKIVHEHFSMLGPPPAAGR
ncbi:MAG TPA: nuclear transport factor 2 family protein [Polyangia bacterium]|nr:nuclear transport factor 2 family protein [Polyangia bacterium]